MPLERDYVLLYGSKEIVEDGLRIRNKVLQPCGCWEAEVWRAPMVYNARTREFEPGTKFDWHAQTGQCRTHAAKVAILQWELGAKLAERGALDPATARHAFLNKLGDGAQRLYADRERVLGEADVIDREIKALERGEGVIPTQKLLPRKRLDDTDKRLHPEGVHPIRKRK